MASEREIEAALKAAGLTSNDGTFVHASTRDVIAALLDASQARETDVSGLVERVFDADAKMADGEVQMTAAEDVLAWLLIEKLGCLDDRNYTPNEAQTILSYRLDAAREMEEKLAASALSGQGWRGDEINRMADAIDAARYAHPDHPRDRPRPFAEADRGDREYAFRLARAAFAILPAPPGERS